MYDTQWCVNIRYLLFKTPCRGPEEDVVSLALGLGGYRVYRITLFSV